MENVLKVQEKSDNSENVFNMDIGVGAVPQTRICGCTPEKAS